MCGSNLPTEVVLPGYLVPTPMCGAEVEGPASVRTLLPNSASEFGYGVEPIKPDERIWPGCGIANGLVVSSRHVSIGDSHFAGVVTFDSQEVCFWSILI